MFYTNVLFNKITGRYYIGYTPDLRKRLSKHYSGKVLPTKSDLNYRLVNFTGFVNRSNALDFEKYLKTGSGVAFMNKHLLKSVKEVLVKDIRGVSCYSKLEERSVDSRHKAFLATNLCV